MTDTEKVIEATDHDFEAGTAANVGKCVCVNDIEHTHDTYDSTDATGKPGIAGRPVCEADGMPTTTA